MHAITACSRVIIINVMSFHARQAIEVILYPFPYIALDVIETKFVWWEHVYWLEEKNLKGMLSRRKQ